MVDTANLWRHFQGVVGMAMKGKKQVRIGGTFDR